jgi:hypothetical protein
MDGVLAGTEIQLAESVPAAVTELDLKHAGPFFAIHLLTVINFRGKV